MSVAEIPPPPGMAEDCLWKSRLQEFVLRASFPHPTYKSFSEGPPHAPQFRSEVWIDELCFSSSHTFPNRKMAEQDAAKHALISVREKVKNEVTSRILQDTFFCKQILNEFAAKMRLEAPTYETNESMMAVPVFVSSLVLNGFKFFGEQAHSKKAAEQLAARSAILSILGSESGTTLCEMMNSKFRLMDTKVMNPSPINTVKMDVAESNPSEKSLTGEELEIGVNSVTGSSIEIAGSMSSPLHTCTAPQVLPQPTRVVATPQTSTADIALPIQFVTPNSGKKRKRKNKKKKAPSTAEPVLHAPLAAGS